MHALIHQGKVIQIEAVPFEVAPALQWVNLAGISPAPQVGWAYNGSSFTAPPSPPLLPDASGFRAWLKANLSLALTKKAANQYPWLLQALDDQYWALVEANLSDAKTNLLLGLTAGQWNALRTAALTTYRLPITLPAAS